MVVEEEKNHFCRIEKGGRKERKKERKGEKKKERKKEKGKKEVAYTPRGKVLILPGLGSFGSRKLRFEAG